MSAAMAIQREAKFNKANPMNTSFSPKAKVMFCRIIFNVRCAWRMSHGIRVRSSDIRAMSAVSMAASVPAAGAPQRRHVLLGGGEGVRRVVLSCCMRVSAYTALCC